MISEELQLKEYHEMLNNRKNIYIVDDDESVCCALKLLLESYGFQAQEFKSAEYFFSAIPNNIPGCLILDIHMPGLDGWEAQQRLLKSRSKRPVIIISADKSDEFYGKALKVGAVGFLQKPFDDQALIDLVNIALENEVSMNNAMMSL